VINVQVRKISDFATKVGSGSTPKGGEANYKSEGVPLIRSMNVHFDEFRYDGLAFLDDDQASALKNVEVCAGDVLLNITGASIGRVTVAPDKLQGARVNQHVCIIRPDESVNNNYLRWYLASPVVQRQINSMESGATRQALTKEKILGFEVPVPDLMIQHQVVAEIEKQFSRLDEAVANLQRVKANLKRYKASVLKAAVEGRLVETEASIAQREGRSYETGEQLLQRLLEVRRERPKGKSKYKEPALPNLDVVSELPDGWAWASVEQVVAHLTDGDHQAPPQTDSGVPFLVIGNVRTGEIDLLNTRFVGEDYYNSLDPYRQPAKGDLLYTLVGSYGIPVRVNTTERFCIQRHMAILRPHAESPMDYLTIAMASDNVFKQATEVSTGTAQMTVPLGGLRSIAFGLPPKSEQTRIVAEFDRHLSIICEVETEVETNIERAQALRQATLLKYFSSEKIAKRAPRYEK
jgi:type I restriction enzyme S subunit